MTFSAAGRHTQHAGQTQSFAPGSAALSVCWIVPTPSVLQLTSQKMNLGAMSRSLKFTKSITCLKCADVAEEAAEECCDRFNVFYCATTENARGYKENRRSSQNRESHKLKQIRNKARV